MKKYLIILLSIVALGSCTEKQKEFSTVQKGMTKEEVIQQVGQPTTKRDILVAEVWKYDLADRTVVFRNGTVYDIITSTEARIDSIEATLKATGKSLKETGKDLKERLDRTGDTIDSSSRRLKDNIDRDTVRKN
jgi:hypothetical protein